MLDWNKLRSGLCLVALVCATVSCNATLPSLQTQRTVAITFDDLPLADQQGETQPLQLAAQVNQRILSSLKRHRAPATGFVTQRNVVALGHGAHSLLVGWNRGDFSLANHGANHADANTLGAAMIEREIIDGEAIIGPMARQVGRSLRFFRFPFNHLGNDADKQSAAMSILKRRGYQLAASTIDTSDYVFDKAFTRAFRAGDATAQAKIKQAYLDHTATQIAYYANLNRQVLGYEPPAIMLLHANRINTETMDAQLLLFRQAGYRFVSLSQAQADPVYANPPSTPIRFGTMWGYRWARDRGVRVDGRLEQEPPTWIVDYGAGKAVDVTTANSN